MQDQTYPTNPPTTTPSGLGLKFFQDHKVVVAGGCSTSSLDLEKAVKSGFVPTDLSVVLARRELAHEQHHGPLLDVESISYSTRESLKNCMKARLPKLVQAHPFLKKIRTRKQKKFGPCWNYEPCEAQVGTVVVGEVKSVSWWCHGLQGQRVPCVRVVYNEDEFFICNVDNAGVKKVWENLGSTWSDHRSIPEEPGTFIPDTTQPNPTYKYVS